MCQQQILRRSLQVLYCYCYCVNWSQLCYDLSRVQGTFDRRFLRNSKFNVASVILNLQNTFAKQLVAKLKWWDESRGCNVCLQVSVNRRVNLCRILGLPDCGQTAFCQTQTAFFWLKADRALPELDSNLKYLSAQLCMWDETEAWTDRQKKW